MEVAFRIGLIGALGNVCIDSFTNINALSRE